MFGLKNSVLGRTFKTTETTGAYDGICLKETAGMATGLIAGTQIATNIGWRAVEAIASGDLAMTFDGGMQKVRRVSRHVLWSSLKNCPEHLWPLEVPVGAMGNKEVMHLLPEQNVMVESDAAEELFNDPFALIPAAALHGFREIHRVCPHAEVVVYTLHFETEQVVFAQCGMLFHCMPDEILLNDAINDVAYNVVPMKQAKTLVQYMTYENNGGAVNCKHMAA